MTLKNNKAPCGCGCDGEQVQNTFKANLAAGARHETFMGADHLVVPVVMLRETVVNGGFVSREELKPQGWNGVPVTIGHPTVNGNAVTANSPAIIEEWRVGQIFNAKLEGDKLKGEAWINVANAEANYPGIIAMLEGGLPLDVSTGYFSTDTVDLGFYKNKPYFEVHRDLKPDHLALLPDEVGACSWADGCGVRVNKTEKKMADDANNTPNPQELAGFRRLLQAVGITDLRTNRRGSDEDFRTMVADLISNDNSPFTAEDEYALREMSMTALRDLRDQYTPVQTNSEGADDMADDKNKTVVATPVTAEQVTEIVTNAINGALGDAVVKAVDEAMNANKRSELVDHIHEALSIDKEELQKLSTNALEAMAPKTNTADFAGRGFKKNGDDDSTVKKFPGMNTNHAAKEAAEAKKGA